MLLEGRDVVQDEDGAAVSADDEVVVAGMDHEIIYRHRRKAVLHPCPARASIHRQEQPGLRSCEKKIRVPGMLHENVHPSGFFRKACIQPAPTAAKVVGLEDIWLEITEVMAVEAHIGTAFRARGSLNSAHLGAHRVEALDVSFEAFPALTSVARELDSPVIRPDVEGSRGGG